MTLRAINERDLIIYYVQCGELNLTNLATVIKKTFKTLIMI